MNRFVAFVLCGFAGVNVAACAPHQGDLRLRAESDFRCAEHAITTDYLGFERFRANGCGKAAVYRCSFSTLDEETSCTLAAGPPRVVDTDNVVATASSNAHRPPFKAEEARASLAVAARAAEGECLKVDGPRGRGVLRVQFAPEGGVAWTEVGAGPFKGTRVGACIERAFHVANVHAFRGSAVTVRTSFAVGATDAQPADTAADVEEGDDAEDAGARATAAEGPAH